MVVGEKEWKCSLFLIIDLRPAFHQQPFVPESRPYTCTNTPLGIFQWKVNVMGLKNAPGQLQRMMDDIFSPVSDTTTPYIDDVLMGTQAVEGKDLYENHDRDVRRTLDCLVSNFLVADLRKCVFFVPEVEFCGYLLGKGVRKPAPGKLMAIEKWEPPISVTRLRVFLGFTNYYSGFVEGYAKIVSPLIDCLQVNKKEGKKEQPKTCPVGPRTTNRL